MKEEFQKSFRLREFHGSKDRFIEDRFIVVNSNILSVT